MIFDPRTLRLPRFLDIRTPCTLGLKHLLERLVIHRDWVLAPFLFDILNASSAVLNFLNRSYEYIWDLETVEGSAFILISWLKLTVAPNNLLGLNLVLFEDVADVFALVQYLVWRITLVELEVVWCLLQLYLSFVFIILIIFFLPVQWRESIHTHRLRSDMLSVLFVVFLLFYVVIVDNLIILTFDSLVAEFKHLQCFNRVSLVFISVVLQEKIANSALFRVLID